MARRWLSGSGRATHWNTETIHADEIGVPIGCEMVEVRAVCEVPLDSEGKRCPRTRDTIYYPALIDVDAPTHVTLHSDTAREYAASLIAAADACDHYEALALRTEGDNLSQTARPPRDDLFRGLFDASELRAEGDDATPQLFGHFAVFDQWTEIDSYWEGRFLERLAPGAFKKTFQEARDQMRVLFQHGYDPGIGDRPIATITALREDETGAYYEADLLQGVPELVVAGLRAGEYGASFRFRVMREEYEEDPGTSEHNPQGLPERTIKEVGVREFGPVTWGAYPEATSGMRSLTDEFVIDRLAKDPERLQALVEARSARLEANARRVEEMAAEDVPATTDELTPAPDDDKSSREQEPTKEPAEATPSTAPVYPLTEDSDDEPWRL